MERPKGLLRKLWQNLNFIFFTIMVK